MDLLIGNVRKPTEPVAWTEREIELFDGMIEVQKYHAEQCDRIGNRVMAEKQKGWDLERIDLLNKCKAMLSASIIKRSEEYDNEKA